MGVVVAVHFLMDQHMYTHCNSGTLQRCFGRCKHMTMLAKSMRLQCLKWITAVIVDMLQCLDTAWSSAALCNHSIVCFCMASFLTLLSFFYYCGRSDACDQQTDIPS